MTDPKIWLNEWVGRLRGAENMNQLTNRVEHLLDRVRMQADIISSQRRRIKRLEEKNRGLEKAIEEAALALKEVYLVD